MAITLEKLMAFVRQHGDVTIRDFQGKTKKLKSGDPDVFDLCEKADRFFYQQRWLTRAEFEKVLESSD